MWKSIIFFVIFYLVVKISCNLEFTNIVCTSLDKEFDDFEYCYLKSMSRSYKYMTLKVNLFKIPITKVKINAALYKRFNGYRPFMYNITIDGCRFMNDTKSNIAMRFLYETFRPYSNMNHTCPYDHDLMVEKLPVSFVNNRVTKILPFPEGDYLLETHWMAYDINRAIVKVYATIS